MKRIPIFTGHILYGTYFKFILLLPVNIRTHYYHFKVKETEVLRIFSWWG
jgi:hypothetical protein